MVFFNFHSNLKETSVSKQWRTGSEATFCGVWSGFALFSNVSKNIFFFIKIFQEPNSLVSDQSQCFISPSPVSKLFSRQQKSSQVGKHSYKMFKENEIF